jgi:hypothetical protein
MKIAVVLYGNLRTFLLPVSGRVIADDFMDCIVRPNNADVFAFTDTNDFYYKGTQYNICDNKTYQTFQSKDVMDNDRAKSIIHDELTARIGSYLKSFCIEYPHDVNTNARLGDLIKLEASVNADPHAVPLIHQYRKIKMAYDLLVEFEKETNVSYDFIIRWRFDNRPVCSLRVESYDFGNVDVYVSGYHPPLVLDWTAFGKRVVMDKCLRLYDDLGFTVAGGNIYSVRCKHCCVGLYCGYKRDEPCPRCHKNDGLVYDDITTASEHHLYKLLENHGYRAANASIGCPHRYNQ